MHPKRPGWAARRPDDSQHAQRGAEAVHLTVSPTARITAGRGRTQMRRYGAFFDGRRIRRSVQRVLRALVWCESSKVIIRFADAAHGRGLLDGPVVADSDLL